MQSGVSTSLRLNPRIYVVVTLCAVHCVSLYFIVRTMRVVHHYAEST